MWAKASASVCRTWRARARPSDVAFVVGVASSLSGGEMGAMGEMVPERRWRFVGRGDSIVMI